MHNLDPDAVALLERLADQHGPPSLDELRAMRTGSPPPELAGTPDDVAVRADILLPLSDATVRARVYRDRPDLPQPLLLWLHGGGFCGGSLDGIDTACSAIARRGRVTVVSLEYRLAPENPFPAALTDVVDALGWLREHGALLGGDGSVAIGGQSAGANLSLAAGLVARERGGPRIDAQVLCYPALDFRLDSDSHRLFDGILLDHELLHWYHEQYLAGQEPSPLSAPLLADDFAGLAPALVLIAGHDPYRDDGRRLVRRLKADKVPVDHVEYPGAIHAFLNFPGALAVAHEAIADIAAYLRRTLGTQRSSLQHVTSLYRRADAAALRRFYADTLGAAEKPVPAEFADLGLVWFAAGSGERELHFVPADDPDVAVPHFCVEVRDLERAAARLRAHGHPVDHDDELAQRPRLFTEDPSGNVVEVVEIHDSHAPIRSER